VNFDALRRLSSRLTCATAAIAASVILGSCGGGGATTTPAVQDLTLLPSAVTMYAGVPYTFTIAGGTPPYLLSSSEPLLLPVPATVNGSTFTVVAANPSVIDAGLGPNDLPVRSLIITVRDRFGATFQTAGSGGIRVARNFLTGYGVVVSALNCGAGAISAQACSGSDSVVRLSATINGNINTNRAVRLCVVRGNYKFVVPETPSNQPTQLLDCYDTTTDGFGVATARIRVPSDATTQIATMRVTDLASGSFFDSVFTIEQGSIVNQLTVLPNAFTFTGPRQGVCGTGCADFVVFDGDPPYSVVSSNGNISVTPATSGSNPARFTLCANNSLVCVANATVVVTDRAQRRATISVTTEEGQQQNPALDVQPTTVTLNDTCGFSASVTAVGGNGGYSVNSTHPRVQATVAGNTITITRLRPDPATGPTFYPTSGQVTVTDGATIKTVTVNNVASFCP
jgi:hypothetical protein